MGLIAGYYGGWVDEVVMRLADVTLAFPTLLLLIAMAAALQPSLARRVRHDRRRGLGGDGAPRSRPGARRAPARVRAGVEGARRRATRASCSSTCCRACVAPVLIAATLGVAAAIMAESSLSFLGLGVQPPTPSWGVDDRRWSRPESAAQRAVDVGLARASRSVRRCWASTCSATRCVMRSIRAMRRRARAIEAPPSART